MGNAVQKSDQESLLCSASRPHRLAAHLNEGSYSTRSAGRTQVVVFRMRVVPDGRALANATVNTHGSAVWEELKFRSVTRPSRKNLSKNAHHPLIASQNNRHLYSAH
jgi:hypothetical protein